MDTFKLWKDFISDHLHLPSPLQQINWSSIGIQLSIKRDDLIHAVISGNKWRKLCGHLEIYKQGNFDGIASMGSAYSNHLHAMSFVCFQLKIPCTCLIYNQGTMELSVTLRDCLNWQAKCTSITRSYASDLRTHSENYLEIGGKNLMWIPEGGSGDAGEMGIRQLIAELPEDLDHAEHLLICGCGTGTTIRGILNHTKHLQIASKRVVRSAIYDFENHPRMNWIGGNHSHQFSKMDAELELFMKTFQAEQGILLDRVYTGPLLLSFSKEYNLHSFQKIYFIHTGGLQGNRTD
ncbi:MAG: hypothetical protein IPM92_09100 [Saprospiraceae bacterium]|nr:hypothetical protein [Saprospiraceae bacterium]